MPKIVASGKIDLKVLGDRREKRPETSIGIRRLTWTGRGLQLGVRDKSFEDVKHRSETLQEPMSLKTKTWDFWV